MKGTDMQNQTTNKPEKVITMGGADLRCFCDSIFVQETTEYIGAGHGRKYGCADILKCDRCGESVVLRYRYYD